MRNQRTTIQTYEFILEREVINADVDLFLAGHRFQVIYDQTTNNIFRQAEQLIKAKEKQ